MALSLVAGCKGCNKSEGGGEAGAGSASATASAPVRPRYDLPTSSNPGPEFQRACYALAKARCTKQWSCSSLAFEVREGPHVTCLSRTTQRCLYERAPKESGVTLEAVEKCAKAYERASCPDVMVDAVADCEGAPGKLEEGSPCVFDAQCASQFCARGADEGCGKCEAGPKEGEPCKLGRCGSAEGLVCIDDKCIKPSAKGGTCSASAGCEGNLVCFAGKCSAPSKSGQKCDPGGKDAADCNAAEGLFCDETTKTCKPYTVANVGDDCSAPDKRCRSDASCIGGKCVASIKTGEPCTKEGPRCIAPAQCLGGRCIIPDVASCSN